MAGKPNRTGRNDKAHYFTMERSFLEKPAWRALSLSARAIYPFLRLEWHGPNCNNNGRIQLSVRQAAQKAGIGVNTAQRAFQDLQAKGYLHVTLTGALGITGEARGPSFEITELSMPGSNRHGGRRLYEAWTEGNDFPIISHNVNNPTGKNGIKTPSSIQGRSCVQKGDTWEKSVSKLVTTCPQSGDVQAPLPVQVFPKLGTSLITTPIALSDHPKSSSGLSALGQGRRQSTNLPFLRSPPTFQMIS